MKKSFQILLIVLVSSAAMAQTRITFDTGIPPVADCGVTFTAHGGDELWLVPGFNGTQGLMAWNATNWKYTPIKAEFTKPATSVSVELGDFGDDADTLFLRVYDAYDNELASADGKLPAAPFGTVTYVQLSVSASDIAYAVFGGVDEITQTSTVIADNFSFEVSSNSPPEAQLAPQSQTVEIGIDTIGLVADVSDYDGDIVAYEWTMEGQLLASGSVATILGGEIAQLPPLVIAAGDPRFPVGTHVIDLSVTDNINDPVVVQAVVNVIDTTVPIIQPVPSVTMLWPPNHTLSDVVIQANACDNSGGMVALSVNVVSSEPEDTGRCCDLSRDFFIDSIDSETGLIALRLRAERYSRSGRTYTITITATDAEENSSSAVISILVPHNRGKGGW